MHRAMIVGLSVLVIVGFAEVGHCQSVPPDVMKGLAKDLAGLQAELQAAQAQAQANASKGAGDSVKVTATEAPVYSGADTKTPVLYKAAKDKSFAVWDKSGDWYAIDLDGKNAGWVAASDVVPQGKMIWNYNDMWAPNKSTASDKSVATSSSTTTADASIYERVYDTMTSTASAIRDKYSNNKYIEVTGFVVNVGVPPSVSMNFSFRGSGK
jgi:hypothetical protein